MVFGEADAWLDLWCHTVFRDYGNAFSFLGPAVQFDKYGSALTLDTLGQRWHWEKTKIWRFLRKVEEDFPLYRLPGSFGCAIKRKNTSGFMLQLTIIFWNSFFNFPSNLYPPGGLPLI